MRRRPASPWRTAEEPGLAGGGTGQAGEQAHRGGLAGAVGAEQRRDLTGLERQRHVGQRGDAAIAVRDGDELGDGTRLTRTSFERCTHGAPRRQGATSVRRHRRRVTNVRRAGLALEPVRRRGPCN